LGGHPEKVAHRAYLVRFAPDSHRQRRHCVIVGQCLLRNFAETAARVTLVLPMLARTNVSEKAAQRYCRLFGGLFREKVTALQGVSSNIVGPRSP
jgi:hypothetical protein